MRFFWLAVLCSIALPGSLLADGEAGAVLLTDSGYADYIKRHGEWGAWQGNPYLYQECQPVSTI